MLSWTAYHYSLWRNTGTIQSWWLLSVSSSFLFLSRSTWVFRFWPLQTWPFTDQIFRAMSSSEILLYVHRALLWHLLSVTVPSLCFLILWSSCLTQPEVSLASVSFPHPTNQSHSTQCHCFRSGTNPLPRNQTPNYFLAYLGLALSLTFSSCYWLTFECIRSDC